MKGIKLAFLLSVLIVSAHSQNYDESKVPPYTLPDALKTLNNTAVTERLNGNNKKAGNPDTL
jgi:hypothetical protein